MGGIMRLRNKKTGEIKEIIEILVDDKSAIRTVRDINSLAELTEEWEDMPEEPKVGYIIDPMEEDCVSADDSGYEEPDVERAKELGIWLETKEEAEKAVEKLKAWQRLKDARFEFGTIKYNLDEESSSTIAYDGIITIKGMAYEDFVDDLDLLFGGEE